MKTKKKYILVLLLTISSTIVVSAQQSATSYINKIISQSKSGITTDFTMTTSTASGKSHPLAGHFAMKGDKFTLSMMDMDIYFDGKTQWNYQVDEVTIMTPTTAEIIETNPLMVISKYSKMSKIFFFKSTHKANVNIEMLPQKNSRNIASILITINKKSETPTAINIKQKDGTSIHLKLDNYKKKVKIPNANFTFDLKKYQGIYINDLRGLL